MNSQDMVFSGKCAALYITEAALEYLISILVTGSFLATLTKEIGLSDSLTGIISAFISLGCLFQLLSLLIRRRRMKTFVVIFSVINQLLFLLLYIIPIFDVNTHIKSALFAATIFSAYLIYNIAHPKKINWFMTLVPDGSRGRFTANKEIVSLIAGMIFTFAMGAVIDRFKESGQTATAFIIGAAVIFILLIFHTLTMLMSIEKPIDESKNGKSIIAGMLSVVKDRDVLNITIVFVLWNIAAYSAVPFYGTYQINELGFSLKLISALSIAYGIVRVSVSRLWGAYADRTSFAVMVGRCFLVMTAGFIFAALAVPSNGIVMFILYNVFNGIASGGINSALVNLIFDHVAPEKRADSLALCQSASGISGFLSTLAVSRLVAYIQESGNRIFGLDCYAQQAASVIALIFTIAAMLYVKLTLVRGRDNTVVPAQH